MRNKITYSIAILFLTFHVSIAQTEWTVPDDKKDRLSPFAFNDSVIQLGKGIYYNVEISCNSCHGDPGKNNWIPNISDPNDPADAKIQGNSDGELFYKISEGRSAMPSFKDRLTNEEIWAVISYLRSFNNDYVQEIDKEIIKKGYDGDVQILLKLLDEHIIQSQVLGSRESIEEALENVEIKLAVARAFGELTLDEIKLTNKEGLANFSVPNNIPGDSVGNLNITAKLMDKELFGEIVKDTLFALGVPTNKPSLVETRAMWNHVKKAPWWVLISYILGVMAAWGVIFYILLQVKKIFEIGKLEETI